MDYRYRDISYCAAKGCPMEDDCYRKLPINLMLGQALETHADFSMHRQSETVCLTFIPRYRSGGHK